MSLEVDTLETMIQLSFLNVRDLALANIAQEYSNKNKDKQNSINGSKLRRWMYLAVHFSV